MSQLHHVKIWWDSVQWPWSFWPQNVYSVVDKFTTVSSAIFAWGGAARQGTAAISNWDNGRRLVDVCTGCCWCCGGCADVWLTTVEWLGDEDGWSVLRAGARRGGLVQHVDRLWEGRGALLPAAQAAAVTDQVPLASSEPDRGRLLAHRPRGAGQRSRSVRLSVCPPRTASLCLSLSVWVSSMYGVFLRFH